MGLLRLILAISVMIGHSPWYNKSYVLVQASVAVEVFYIISGYYMAMVIDYKYQQKIKAFYTNRIIKIFSIYWFVLLLILCIELIHCIMHHDLKTLIPFISLPFAAQVWVLFSNIFILGLDTMMFSTLQNGNIVFVHNFAAYKFAFHNFMWLPQAWSISLELYFYLLIPFLLKHKKILFLVFFCSLSINVLCFSSGFNSDPWSYRFFFSELWLFLLGSIAYINRESFIRISPCPLCILVLYVIYLLFYYSFYQYNEIGFKIILYILTFLSINTLFNLTKNFKVDKIIGETSYPFYLLHLLVLSIINPKNLFVFLLAILVTFILSFIIEKYFYSRVQKIRVKVE
ncbi:MAG: acyltransferase [Burkholderiales bacterium]|nr:acyltransferase [Burkholderiales bacterium]